MVKRRRTAAILFCELLRSVARDWKQFFSVIAISFLALCLFSGLTANAANLKDRADFVYRSSAYADLYVTTASRDPQDAAKLAAIPEVDIVEERINLSAARAKDGFNILAAPQSNTLSVPVMKDGKSGFVIMNKYASSSGLALGDELALTIQNHFADESKLAVLFSGFANDPASDVFSQEELVLTFEITGTMYHPEGVQNSAYSATIAYTSPEAVADSLVALLAENYDVEGLNKAIQGLFDLGELGQENLPSLVLELLRGRANQLLIKAPQAEKALSKIKEYYAGKDGSNLVIASRKESLAAYQSLNQDVVQSMQLTFVFPVIFFLVSVLVILTTISQMIIKNRGQIGSLKATGVPRKSIYIHYMSYGIALCLLGGVLGFFLGPLIIPPVLNVKYSLLWDLPRRPVSLFQPLSLAVLLVLVGIATLCSFAVSFSVIREKPVDTLRPLYPKLHKKPVSGASFLNRHTPLPLKMALRNVWRDKGKTLMVMLGTMGCTALLVCGFGIMNTLDHSLELDYGHNMKIDISATFGPGEDVAVLQRKAEELEGVERCEKTASYPVSLSKDVYLDTKITLLEDSSSYFTPEYGDGGLTLDQTTAAKIGAAAGDKVKLIINAHVYEKVIDHIFTSSVLHGVFDTFSFYPEERIPATAMYIDLKPGADPLTVKEELVALGDFTTVSTFKETKKHADDLLSTIKIMTNVVKIFAILLSVVVIYNLTSLNLSERSRDIATMKVLGFSFQEISATLTGELIFDTLVGSLGGLLLGFPMTVLVLAVNKTDLLTFIYHVNPSAYLFAFLISVAAAIIVSSLLNLKLRKIKMAESLKAAE